MLAFLAGIAVLAVALSLIRLYVNASPERMARAVRFFGGLALAAGGALLVMNGKALIGLPMLAVAVPLIVRGSTIVEAYLHRGPSTRREDLNGHARARLHDPPREGAMTEEEAYEILGLDPGAGADAIRRAHRALIKKVHPGQGGTTYLASRINQAKDKLLRHR